MKFLIIISFLFITNSTILRSDKYVLTTLESKKEDKLDFNHDFEIMRMHLVESISFIKKELLRILIAHNVLNHGFSVVDIGIKKKVKEFSGGVILNKLDSPIEELRKKYDRRTLECSLLAFANYNDIHKQLFTSEELKSPIEFYRNDRNKNRIRVYIIVIEKYGNYAQGTWTRPVYIMRGELSISFRNEQIPMEIEHKIKKLHTTLSPELDTSPFSFSELFTDETIPPPSYHFGNYNEGSIEAPPLPHRNNSIVSLSTSPEQEFATSLYDGEVKTHNPSKLEGAIGGVEELKSSWTSNLKDSLNKIESTMSHRKVQKKKIKGEESTSSLLKLELNLLINQLKTLMNELDLSKKECMKENYTESKESLLKFSKEIGGIKKESKIFLNELNKKNLKLLTENDIFIFNNEYNRLLNKFKKLLKRIMRYHDKDRFKFTSKLDN